MGYAYKLYEAFRDLGEEKAAVFPEFAEYMESRKDATSEELKKAGHGRGHHSELFSALGSHGDKICPLTDNFCQKFRLRELLFFFVYFFGSCFLPENAAPIFWHGF